MVFKYDIYSVQIRYIRCSDMVYTVFNYSIYMFGVHIWYIQCSSTIYTDGIYCVKIRLHCIHGVNV